MTLLVVAITALLVGGAPLARAADISDVEAQEVKLINDYRGTQGIAPLTIDGSLSTIADWMGADMPAFNYFGHEDHLGRDPFARMAAFGYPSDTWRGENLAAGNAEAEATFEQWRNSPGHNANMLNANYKFVGISRVDAPDSTYKSYWVTEFGSKAGNDSSTSTPKTGTSGSGSGGTTGGGTTTPAPSSGGTSRGSTTTTAATTKAAKAKKTALAKAKACRKLRRGSHAYTKAHCAYWTKAAARYARRK